MPRTLSTRIALLAGFLALGGVATLSLILIREQRNHILAEVVHSSESVAETIRLSINHDMLGNRREGVREVIESVGGHSGIAGVRLLNKEGRITYSSRAEEVGRVVDKRSEACVQCHSMSRPLTELDQASRSRVFDHPEHGRVLSEASQPRPVADDNLPIATRAFIPRFEQSAHVRRHRQHVEQCRSHLDTVHALGGTPVG